MSEFFAALSNPAVPFVRYALVAGLVSSPAFGIVGSYVTVKRISSIAGAMAHSVLAGVGLSLFLTSRAIAPWFTPNAGAMVAGILSALLIGAADQYAKEREDTIIGAMWSVGMAVGILLIARTRGYVNPMTYLFGNILVLSASDLWLIVGLDVLVIAVGVLLYPQLQAVAFDEPFMRVRGVNTGAYGMTLLLLCAITIVLLTNVVGIIMVIALLTLPAATVGLFARSLWQMIIGATLITAFVTVIGLGISYSADLPSGSTIIVVTAALYLIALALRAIRTRLDRRKVEAAA